MDDVKTCKIITATGQEVSIETNVKEVWISPFDPRYTGIDATRPRHFVSKQTFIIDGEVVTAEEASELIVQMDEEANR